MMAYRAQFQQNEHIAAEANQRNRELLNTLEELREENS